ncbi:hypothetical protein FGSG_12241 [Fusarium graminearum PH-1]|uniref:Chromosome 2, complete genome n=1 Tax=Gibberella zeae (strain ATCC MYA-4620 / CBS 123657 / FGSC 9075 / NRRL 31084 / PH-1) TaxID=229533 RepID=I1S5X0_GIBZE|nr:hypothetical protein FGSG_12241 [Fusarium graminearum PH-1]ESU08584.1 hypothetical protein FGSG_12241 [Fusarium graminearum PH-1]CEF79538.1 unnamed protein product [Fusarium graminearum]|eukprot:XP_011321083.1 hypothetical protein FGSG_12241 [Fusarium graminearum PH-1]
MALLHRKAWLLSVLQIKYKDEGKPIEELPEEYRVALNTFRFFLRKAINDTTKILKQEFECSPPMRWLWGARTDFTEDHKSLLYILEILSLDEEAWTRQSTLVDELERLLKNKPDVDRLISAHVYKSISYLSVLSQCAKQIELYQPWARHYFYQKMFARRYERDYSEEHEAELKSAIEMVKVIRGRQIPLHKLGWTVNPSGGKFKYPYEKRLNKDTVNALRQAEANLDVVWAELDRLTETNKTHYKDLALHSLLSRTLRRTPEWLEPEQTKKKGQPGATDKDLVFLNRPLSNLFLGESEQETPKTAPSGKKKSKAKTKGEPAKAQNIDTPPAEAPEPENVDRQPTFTVDARALKVFRTLFFNPEVTSSPGVIAWNDFSTRHGFDRLPDLEAVRFSVAVPAHFAGC